MELAVYGKGGIGKSTVSANLSAALADSGQKVLQIGCDPKHDSTRLLMKGRNIPTVLESLKEKGEIELTLQEILFTGYKGCGCIEAGGPKPGVGCAGRGIISSFEFLKRHHTKEQYDIVIYDVLGDVVCGGFAVPVRREYADAIVLVTSGEYMALYAANNILRGIRNYDQDLYSRVAGIIYNERRLKDEDLRVERFARAVGLPILAKVPRSDAFAKAEELRIPVLELNGFEEEKTIFKNLAKHLEQEDLSLYKARPLTDEILESVILGTRILDQENVLDVSDIRENTVSSDAQRTDAIDSDDHANVLISRPPLYGCAFNGAATCAIHLTDAVVIAHSPRSCAFYTFQNISSSARKNLFNRGILMPSAISPNFVCSEIGQVEAVFGGMDRLQECVDQVLDRKPGSVIIISSCVTGIIGDDIRELERLSARGIPVITIPADGDIAGDYMEGIRLCMHAITDHLVDRNVKPESRLVNLICETGVSNNIQINFENIKNMLDSLEIGINCRLLGDATTDQVRKLLRAPLNILACEGEDTLDFKEWLHDTYGCQFIDGAFPIGFEASRRWLSTIGDYFHCGRKVDEKILLEKMQYEKSINRLRPYLQGKTILFTTINANMDWLIEACVDVGMRFLWVGVLNYLHMDIHVTNHPEYGILVEEFFDYSTISQKIEQYHPDIVLSNYTSTVKEGSYLMDALPMTPVVGFQSAIPVLNRWVTLEKNRRKGGWKEDERWFKKYFGS